MKRPGFLRDTGGAAMAEFVLWLAVVTVPLLSVVDLGVYAFQKMQLDLASQASVQTAWRLCDTPAKLPATQNCTGLASAMTVAAQSTSLGTAVTVASGSPVEGYYCTNTSNVLQAVSSTWTVGGTPPAKPADCSAAVATSTTAPGEYIKVTVKYTFVPVFNGVSLASFVAGEKTRSAWMRLS